MTAEQRARINAAVAEHVMGWRVSPWSIHPNEKPIAAYAEEGVGLTWRPTVGFALATDEDHVPPEVLLPDNAGDMPGWEAFDGTSWKGVTDYSTTWEGMGLVVERMREEGWYWDIGNGANRDGPYWTAWLDNAGEDENGAGGWRDGEAADTPMLAVALCALKAKGVDVAALTGGET